MERGMRLDRDLVSHIARLASLEHSAKSGERRYDDDALDQLAAEMQKILDYVDELSAVNVEGVPPTQHGVEVQSRLREDELGPQLSPDEALANAPARLGDHLLVPRVIGET